MMYVFLGLFFYVRYSSSSSPGVIDQPNEKANWRSFARAASDGGPMASLSPAADKFTSPLSAGPGGRLLTLLCRPSTNAFTDSVVKLISPYKMIWVSNEFCDTSSEATDVCDKSSDSSFGLCEKSMVA